MLSAYVGIPEELTFWFSSSYKLTNSLPKTLFWASQLGYRIELQKRPSHSSDTAPWGSSPRTQAESRSHSLLAVSSRSYQANIVVSLPQTSPQLRSSYSHPHALFFSTLAGAPYSSGSLWMVSLASVPRTVSHTPGSTAGSLVSYSKVSLFVKTTFLKN